jgi:hypothetical protein
VRHFILPSSRFLLRDDYGHDYRHHHPPTTLGDGGVDLLQSKNKEAEFSNQGASTKYPKPVTGSPSASLSWSPRCSSRTCIGRGIGCSAGIRWGSRIGLSACIGRGIGCSAGIRWGSRIGRSARIGRSRGPGGGWGTRTTWGTCYADHRRDNMGHTIAQPEFSVGIVAPTVGNPI